MLNTIFNLVLSVITLIYSAGKIGNGADGISDILMVMIPILMTGYNLDTAYNMWQAKTDEVELLKETIRRR